MNFVEYATYATSIISTYTGLSFLSLNSLPIFLLVKGYLTSERKSSSQLRGKAGRKASYEIGRNSNESRPGPKKTKTSEVKIVTYDNVFTIYQAKMTVHNLPPPFTINCREYSKEGRGWSRAACIEDCMKDEIFLWESPSHIGDLIFSRRT